MTLFTSNLMFLVVPSIITLFGLNTVALSEETKSDMALVCVFVRRLDRNEKYRQLVLHECSSSSPLQLVRSPPLDRFRGDVGLQSLFVNV